MKKVLKNLKEPLYIILGLILLFTVSPLINTSSSQTHVAGKTIVLDPGHGGSDSGSTACAGYLEKEANLDIAIILEERLTTDGAIVVKTRDTNDENPGNTDRANIANENNADVLLSIHLNGSTDNTIDGTQALYGKKRKDEKFAQMIHDELWSSLKSTPDFIDFGITNFASGALLKSDMPATIAESVFISDVDECTWLTDGTGERQQEIADALYDGLNSWFSQSDTGGGDSGNNGGGNGGGPKCDNPPCNK